jgi:hypothetical protein
MLPPGNHLFKDLRSNPPQTSYVKKLRDAETHSEVHKGTMLQRSAGQIVLAAMQKQETVGVFASTVTVGTPRWQMVFLIVTAIFTILVVVRRNGLRSRFS